MNKRMIQGKVNLQSWVAADTFATVTDWLVRARGVMPTSISNVVELAFEELVMVALDNGGAAITDADEIEQVMQAIALNRYRGRTLARLSAKREFQSEQWRSAAADASLRPGIIGPEQRSAEAARQLITQKATPEEVHYVERRIPKMRAEDVDPILRAQFEVAARQMRAGISSSNDNSAYEGIPVGQETSSEPDEGEFDAETAHELLLQRQHQLVKDQTTPGHEPEE